MTDLPKVSWKSLGSPMITVTFCCARCGSEDVMRDAWAAWSVQNQCWEISSVQDHAYCNTCDGDTSLEQKEITP